MRKTLAAVLVLAVVAAIAVAIVLADDAQTGRRPALARALDSIPSVTLTASFTDWGQARDSLGDPGPAASERADFLDRAYDRDLSSVSILGESALPMAQPYGWSVFDLDWEMYAQSDEGAVAVVSLRAGTDAADITAALSRLGYREPPADAEAGGVWVGGVDLVAGIDSSLTSQLASVAVLADEGLVVTSDTPAYAARTVATIRGDSNSMNDEGVVALTAVPLFGDLVAVVNAPGRACEVSGFATTDRSDRQAARDRARSAGGLQAFSGLGFGLEPPEANGLSAMEVVMTYDAVGVADEQRDVRSQLMAGPAVGQGGDFADRFTFGDDRLEGPSVVLTVEPVDDSVRLLSDLGTGPLLFAWCGSDSAPDATA